MRNSRGALLLQKRSPFKETFPGLWDISAAGHISAGDSSRETAVRELREELGISLKSNALRFLFSVRCSCRLVAMGSGGALNSGRKKPALGQQRSPFLALRGWR
ncbi:MAG: NUDIX domain-containing protein [Chitinispirillaceae bacterium]|nr:NUDIX domain-containing protein [Chitinispirillaceae bacterium]